MWGTQIVVPVKKNCNNKEAFRIDWHCQYNCVNQQDNAKMYYIQKMQRNTFFLELDFNFHDYYYTLIITVLYSSV